MANVISTENLNTGTTAWQITKADTTQIACYANLTSLDPGQSLTFYVSTLNNGTLYSLSIYRLGDYNGLGGCLKATIPGLVGVAQGYWDSVGLALVNMPSALVDSSTKLCDANWASSYTWTVPSNACTGVYLAMFTDSNGYQSATSFVVRGNSNADYVVVRPFTTDQAYNNWGNYSLYTTPTVGVKVSFNRPTQRNGGSNNLVAYEMQIIKWLESQGYNLAYLSDIDMHANAALLLNHGGYLSIGHDEYWTKEMRNGVEAAIAGGVGAAFCGANTCYWQARLENDAAGNPYRTLTCYKVTTGAGNLALDPFFGVDNTRVTSNWRDAVVNRPENTMIGIMYYDNTPGNNQNTAWTVDASATSRYLAGTGLVPGQSYGSDLTGYEWDHVFSGGPNNLQIIGTSSVTGTLGVSNANTTTYFAPSGVLVFASGSVAWTWALDSYRLGAANVPVVPGMQALMANIMTGLIRPKNPTGFSSFMAHR